MICHECQFEVDPFWKTQPVKYREGISYVVIATKSEHQVSCGVEYSLEASLKIARKPNKYEVAVVKSGMNERDHQITEAVVGNVPM